MHRAKRASLNVCAQRWITETRQVEILSCFKARRVYFVLVVGHESGRRNRRTAPRTESGFPRSEGPAKQSKAGRAEAGGQRQGSDPQDDRSQDRRRRPPGTNGLARAQRQVGLESPPVTRGSCGSGRKVCFVATESHRGREFLATRSVGPNGPQRRTEVRSRARDPRNGSGRSQRSEVVHALGLAPCVNCGGTMRSRAKSHGRPVGKPLRHPIWVSGRENDSRTTVCVSDLARGSSC